MVKHALRRWSVLIHMLPARPLYLRARIRKLLVRAGAAPLKKAVYVLPHSDAGLERLRMIATEIESAGASAFVCEATFPDGETERAVERAYDDELRRLARAGGGPAPASRGEATLVGLRWVTRKGLHVDRLACAWVVRRFVDPSATFRFVPTPGASGAALRPGEIGFDMPGAAITHEKGGCSVESLVRRVGLSDPAITRIAQIVHDIDLKDRRHRHAETPVFEQLLLGVVASEPRDENRLERGLALFDALYAAASRGAPLAGAAVRRAPSVRIPPGLRRRRS